MSTIQIDEQSDQSFHEHGGPSALLLQRLVSSLMLVLSGMACLISGHWSCIAAGTAYLFSLGATWLRPQLAGWLWGASSLIGFALWAFWDAVG